MEFTLQDKITTSTKFQVELTNSEKVADKGDLADKVIYVLPSQFDINNKTHKNELLAKMKPIMVETGLDTLIVSEELHKEHIFHLY